MMKCKRFCWPNLIIAREIQEMKECELQICAREMKLDIMHETEMRKGFVPEAQRIQHEENWL